MELNDQTINSLELKPGNQIHFIGIGGSSMSGLAEFSINRGYNVSGSDNQSPDSLKKLEALGAKIFVGHNADNISDKISLVVYTVAVGQSNPELLRAHELNLPVVERGIFLGFIANHFDERISVAGVHGKTTTTSMLAAVLKASEKRPNVHLGGVIPWAGSNVVMDSGNLFLTEACEYHNNFLHIDASIGVILNLEPEHLDFFGNFENMKASFREFAAGVNRNGLLVVCADSPDALECARAANADVVTYSLKQPDPISDFTNVYGNAPIHHYYAKIISSESSSSVITDGYSFVCYEDGVEKLSVTLHVPGMHNVGNALAAIAVAAFLGCDNDGISGGFDLFRGAKRRFDCVGTYNGAYVISDYAHHPTEIRVTIDAAKGRTSKKVIAIFQPHTFSRIISLRDKFPAAFENADTVIVTDIYAARETDTHEISSEMLSNDLKSHGIESRYIGPFCDVAEYVKGIAEKGDIILLLGAGTIDKLADFFQ